MSERKPWRPHLKHLPFFNPFESSTDWNEQIGANDQIEIEDESDPKDSVPADPSNK